MGCTVRELKSRLTAAEMVEWMGFSLLEPIGDDRADDRARGIMAMVLAASGARNVDPVAFLPVYEPPQERDAGDDLAAVMAKMDALAGYDGGDDSGGAHAF